MAFLEVEMQLDILIPPDQLDTKGLFLHKVIIFRLMKDVAPRKSSNEHEFFVAVTSLIKINEGRIQNLTGDILFPVTFECSVYKPYKGEILVETMT